MNQYERAQQNKILRQHGYTWHKAQDVFGPSDNGDTAAMVWTLFAPDGTVVTVAKAMQAITAQAAQADVQQSARAAFAEQVIALRRSGYTWYDMDFDHQIPTPETVITAPDGAPLSLDAAIARLGGEHV